MSSATVLQTEPALLVPFEETTTSCPPERARLADFSGEKELDLT